MKIEKPKRGMLMSKFPLVQLGLTHGFSKGLYVNLILQGADFKMESDVPEGENAVPLGQDFEGT